MLENKEKNQNIRPVLELVCVPEQGIPTSHRAGRETAAPGDVFTPRSPLVQGRAKEGGGIALKGLFQQPVHFQEISLLFFLFFNGKAKSS